MPNIYRVSWTYNDGEGEAVGYCEADSVSEAFAKYHHDRSVGSGCQFLVLSGELSGSTDKNDWWHDRSPEPTEAYLEEDELEEMLTGYETLSEIPALYREKFYHSPDDSVDDIVSSVLTIVRASFHTLNHRLCGDMIHYQVREIAKSLIEAAEVSENIQSFLGERETSPEGVPGDVSSAGPEGEVSNV